MRVVVTGATGNVGTAVVEALSTDPKVNEIIGLARRRPELAMPKAAWVAADVTSADLPAIFAGADAVIHLAWLIQPSRDEATMEAVNVEGSRKVFAAAGTAGVRTLLYASSVGAYSEGPKDRRVDESWPTDGIQTSFYSRHKAAVERILDRFEVANPQTRVVRMRPGLIFRRESATGIRRLFLGPLFPGSVARRALIPVVPDLPRLRVQAVHSEDVAEAYRLALHSGASGAFNVAADPVLDRATLAELLGARVVKVPAAPVRAAAAVSWRLRMQPTPPGWLDLALGVPLLDSARARGELGWSPRYDSTEAVQELMEGLRTAAGLPTPPLDPASSGRLRVQEFKTGVGARAY